MKSCCPKKQRPQKNKRKKTKRKTPRISFWRFLLNLKTMMPRLEAFKPDIFEDRRPFFDTLRKGFGGYDTICVIKSVTYVEST